MPAPLIWPSRDPDEVKTYGIDFSELMGAINITGTPTWTVNASGVTTGSAAGAGTQIATLSVGPGGTDGTVHLFTARVTGTDGQIHERTAVQLCHANRA